MGQNRVEKRASEADTHLERYAREGKASQDGAGSSNHKEEELDQLPGERSIAYPPGYHNGD